MQTKLDRHEQTHQADIDRLEAGENAAPPGAEDLQAAADRLKRVVEAASGRSLAFDIHDDTESLYVEVRDLESDEIIKQIPSEEVLAMQYRIEAAIGMLFDQEA